MKSYHKIHKDNYTLADLLEILQILRAPDGCPWDREQTHESVIGNLLEESYEVVDAIEHKSDEKLQEELGDVLMQVAFHSVLAEERKAFNMQDILNTLCNKLIYRHSFVFGEDNVNSAQEALEFWDKNKTVEKGQANLKDRLDDLPKAFPALLRASKAIKRIEKAGASFTDGQDIYKSIIESLKAIEQGERSVESIGNLYLQVTLLANQLHISAEEATRQATNRLIENALTVEQEKGGIQGQALSLPCNTNKIENEKGR